MPQSQAPESVRLMQAQPLGQAHALQTYQLHTSQVSIPQDWYDEEYRKAYLDSHVEQIIGWQIKVNREARGLTQRGLAALCNTRQPVISRLESAECSGYNVSTLLKIAHAFKCALDIRFIPYSNMASIIEDNSPQKLFAEEFNNEIENLKGNKIGK